MNQPLVSVIIPFFNGVNWLCEAVDSVLAQDYKNIEILVINDGSKENIRPFLDQYKHVIDYYQIKNHGAAYARNYGISKAKGTYVAFLDSDDIWCENKLSIQASEMMKKNAVWSHSAYQLFEDESGEVKTHQSISEVNGNIFPECVYSVHIATPSVMIERNFLMEHPEIRFKEGYRYGEDGCFWFHIASLQPILAINQELVKVRLRGTNASFDVKVQIIAKSNYYRYLKMNNLLNDIHGIPLKCLKYCDNIREKYKLDDEKEDKFKYKVLFLPAWLLFKFYSK